jgi:hypothetical protein
MTGTKSHKPPPDYTRLAISASVYEGRLLLGVICHHPTNGFIALSADRSLIGTTFPNRIAAMAAIKESGKESQTT